MAPTAYGARLPLAAIVLAAAASTLLMLAPAAANPESDALLALKSGLQDPDNVLASWDPDLVDPCTWFHVTCDGNNRVTRLDLADENLSGTLAPELGKLDQLKSLEISGNSIHGSTIPEEFGNLENLITLDLFCNNLSGHIPASVGKLKSPKILRIDHNRLTGPIPRELIGLSNLQNVDFSNNDLCGTIPTSGPFQNFPQSSFANNPRLGGPGRQLLDGGRSE